MRLGKITPVALFASALFFAACSSGSSSTSVVGGIQAAIQDLGVDPNGLTTVIELPSAPGASVSPGNFEADGGQIALSVSVSGVQASVTWDDRVTSNDQVRVVGLTNVVEDYAAVTSSDMTAPTFTLAAGTQTPGLGGDTFEVAFSGPRVVEAQAEDPANWTIAQDGDTYDLTGSTIDYDPVTGVADVTLGVSASLHASFGVIASGINSVADVAVPSSTVAGAATGDAVAPALVSAIQVLGADEFGRVVEFTFDEAMDPASSLSNFVTTLPVFASSVTQPSAGVMRVTFTEPMIPGVDSVTLQNLTDAHGNAFVGAVAPVTQGSSVANAFNGSPELRSVSNSANDLVIALFDQAIDPADATDATKWSLDVDGNPVDLSGATFDYDMLAKSLSVNLGLDFPNGSAFDLGPAIGNQPLDIDGDLFVSTFSGVVAGDLIKPRILFATQNRSVALDGTFVDVTFEEDVDQATAEDLANWSAPNGQVILSITRMADFRTVRIEFASLMLPGDDTISTDTVEDLAGNMMNPTVQVPLLSTDTIAPGVFTTTATAIAGANNDTIVVLFDDDMVQSEVEDQLNWTVNAELGVPFDTSLATIGYDTVSREATLTFTGGGDLPSRHGFSVLFQVMRDLGGNTVSAAETFGLIDGDISYPIATAAWVDGLDDSIVHLRMSEPSAQFADYYDPLLNPLALTQYELFDVLDVSAGFPVGVVVSADAMQVDLDFSVTVVAGSHTLDLRGITDLAGNQLFPVLGMPILAEDPTPPTLALGLSTGLTVAGEENDQLAAVFDRDMSPWGMQDAANYSLTLAGSPVDLSRATLSFDGARTVTFKFNGLGAADLQTAGSYALSASGLSSLWGVPIAGASADTVVAGGDSTVPTIDVGRLRLDASAPTNSVLVELSEAVRGDDATDETAIDISGVNPATAVQVGRRTTRATFGSVSVGQTVDISMRDLAGNLGLASQLIVGQDVAGPAVSAVSGLVQPNAGGDRVIVQFDRPVQSGTALDWHHYTATQGATVLDLSTATPRYDSTSNSVHFILAEGQDLQDGVQVHVTATGVTDLAGLVMTPADSLGNTTGDSDAPSLVSAYVNYREDIQGYMVDVLFSEDVDPILAILPVNWLSSGGQTPLSVTQLSGNSVRVTYATPLVGGETLSSLGLMDLAGNASGALNITVAD